MTRHFTLVTTDAEGYARDYRPFQSNKMGDPRNDAAANAKRRLPRTDMAVEIEVYEATLETAAQEPDPERYVGKACWDPTGSVKTFVWKDS